MSEQQRDAIGAAREMTAALNALTERLDTVNAASEGRDRELKRYGHRNRVLVVLDIAATLISLLALYLVHSNTATVSQVRSVVTCQGDFNAAAAAGLRARAVLGNQSADAQENLWRQFYSLVQHPLPPAQGKRLFTADLKTYFTAVDRVRHAKLPSLPSGQCH